MNRMKKLLSNLNKEQLHAVTLPEQSALILAGAGSGKTKVLITRIAWLINTQQILPNYILAVTFTNKAAQEILTRLSNIIAINTHNMWIGTFHSLCNRLLRIHHREANLPKNFQILDSQDQISIIKRLFKTFCIDSEKYIPRNFMYYINSAKEKGLRAKDIKIFNNYDKKFVEIYHFYDQQCEREGVVDFSELLLRVYELFLQNTSLCLYYQKNFRHILIDEFQDINNIQYQWLKLISGYKHHYNHSAVFAVGDDDQSIYAFRGAHIDIIKNFKYEFQIQHLIKLEQNYRSSGHILNAANILIAHNNNRLGKKLHTNLKYGEQICVFHFNTDLQEAQWIVKEIKILIKQGKICSKIAVLYRSNAQSRILEHALFTAAIKYHVYGGYRFFERAEIKCAIAYLQLIENLHNDSAFLRVVNFPNRGIGIKTVEYLQNIAHKYQCSLYTAVSYTSIKNSITLNAFVKLIENMRLKIKNLSLKEIVQIMLKMSGLSAYFQNIKEGTGRVDNLTQLVNAATVFITEKEFNNLNILQYSNIKAQAFSSTSLLSNISIIKTDTIESPLSSFLSYVLLETNSHDTQCSQVALQLMTVHAAKGLEFDIVFITGLEEGLFPHVNHIKEKGGIEEERRLMYVAITRAREKLYMSFSKTRMLYGKTHYNVKSRFFDELPNKSIKLYSQIKIEQYNSKICLNKILLQNKNNTVIKQISNVNTISNWYIGQHVIHTKFGDGNIINITYNNVTMYAHINFNKNGIKLLDLNIAQLKKYIKCK